MGHMINVQYGHVVGHAFINLVAGQYLSQPIIYATWLPVSNLNSKDSGLRWLVHGAAEHLPSTNIPGQPVY